MSHYLSYVLWVDDTKDLNKQLNGITDNLVLCRTYKQTIEKLTNIYNEDPNAKVFVCLDYHLGKMRTGTGYDIARHIVINKLPICGFTVISIYLEGKNNIEDLLGKYYHQEESCQSAIEYYKNKDAEMAVQVAAQNKTEETAEIHFTLLQRIQTWLIARVSALTEHVKKSFEKIKNL